MKSNSSRTRNAGFLVSNTRPHLEMKILGPVSLWKPTPAFQKMFPRKLKTGISFLVATIF